MTAISTHSVHLLSRAAWSAGPIFTKELRVASRQRRSYLLRFAYVCFLGLCVVWTWYVVIRSGRSGSVVLQASRMAEAGKQVTIAIVWFQFITAQLLAVVLLGGAISSEIRQRTLDVLFVTPINSFHIVIGKFFSKLLQLGLLLAVSMPLLAVARVFGGVPWDYVLSSLVLTLAVAAFAGSLSLLFSVYCRHGYQAVMAVIASYAMLFGGVFGVVALLVRDLLNYRPAGSAIMLANPFVVMALRTQAMLWSGGNPGTRSWLPHVLVLLVAAAGALLLAIWRVRRVALRSVLGTCPSPEHGRAGSPRPIRPVRGSPIVWKELRKPWLARGRSNRVGQILFCILVGAAIIVPIAFGAPPAAGFYFVIYVLYLLFVLRLGVLAASGIASEKEARAWPVLLATPLDDRDIVRGKSLAAFYRAAPLLIPIPLLYTAAYVVAPSGQSALHALLFTGFAAVSLLGTIVFLIGLGVYFSVLLRTTTGAVAATLGVYFGLKFFCCGGLSFYPFILVASMTAIGAKTQGRLSGEPWFVPLVIGLSPVAVYAAIGLALVRAAARRLRRKVF